MNRPRASHDYRLWLAVAAIATTTLGVHVRAGQQAVPFQGGIPVAPLGLAGHKLPAKPMEFDVEELIATMPLEERVYRFRCVEACSMVLPWTGFMLSDLLKKVEPLGSAKYVAFRTALRPEVNQAAFHGLTRSLVGMPRGAELLAKYHS